MSRLLSKAFDASGVIPPYTFAAFGGSDGVVTVANATSNIVGITPEVGAADGQRVDVTMMGEEYVTAGAAFTAGSQLVPNATGQAIAAAPAHAVVEPTYAVALESATAAGDVVRVVLRPGVVIGA